MICIEHSVIGAIPIDGSKLKNNIMSKEQKEKRGFIYMVNELGQVILKEVLDKMIEREEDLSLAMGKDCVK